MFSFNLVPLKCNAAAAAVLTVAISGDTIDAVHLDRGGREFSPLFRKTPGLFLLEVGVPSIMRHISICGQLVFTRGI